MDYLPLIVSWNITGACNLRCPHCYLAGGRRWPGELSTDEALALIAQMAEAGTELLILTGGEPLLRRDLPALASYAAQRGIAVVLGTNGTLLDGKHASALRESGVVAAGISIDSLDAARHDAFRGVEGAWQRAVEAIDACRAAGLGVLIHTTALKMNLDEIPALVRFAHDQGARAFHLFFLVCTGRGDRLTDLSPEEYERLLGWLLEAQDLYPSMMLRARCAPYIRRLAALSESSLTQSAGCLAGTSYCRVTPAGDVTPCPYLPVRAGNVRQQRFRQVWESSPVLAQLRRPRLKGKCGQCAFSRGNDPVCIGCRARAFALGADVLGADPWCRYEPGAQAAEPAPAEPSAEAVVPWTADATHRLARVPAFIRDRVRRAAERYARARGLACVSPEVLEQLRARAPGHVSR